MQLGLLINSSTYLNKNELEIYDANLLSIKNYYATITNILLKNIKNINKKYQEKCLKMNYYDIFYLMIQKSLFNHSYDSIIDAIYSNFNINIAPKTLRKNFKQINLLAYLF